MKVALNATVAENNPDLQEQLRLVNIRRRIENRLKRNPHLVERVARFLKIEPSK